MGKRKQGTLLAISALLVCVMQVTTIARPKRAEGKLSVWEQAQPIRAGAGGLEAERDTWTRTPKRFEATVLQRKQSWSVPVAGEARPTMRRLKIECLSGTVETPFLLSDKNYDFRSVPELVASVTKGAKTEEEKALALRELLIGEGFYFHYSPPHANDPIHRLTGSGYGFCGIHAQMYDELAQTAGLRSRIVSHPFASGHATNEVFYNGQWHFIDTNGEAFIRRPDGVIPSYEDIRKNPALFPFGDAYGQTSCGITGSRFFRALYTAETKSYERSLSSSSRYDTLDFTLRPGESISWEWEDADFRHNRNTQGRPVYGTGQMERRLNARELASAGNGLRAATQQFTLAEKNERGVARLPITSPYPVMEAQVSARVSGSAEGVAIRISKDGGKTWLDLKQGEKDGRTTWQAALKDPDSWLEEPDKDDYTETSRTLRPGQYGYLMEIGLTRKNAAAPALSDLHIVNRFRHYAPTLPYLKEGANELTYEDRGAKEARKVRVTLEWEERWRAANLSSRAEDWGWETPAALTPPTTQAELPTLATGPKGALHLVYAVGAEGARRIAYRRYEGGKWQAERLLTPLGQDANHPVAAEDAQGTVWLAYQTGGQWKGGDVYALSLKGDSLSEPTRLNANDPYHIAFFPSITAHGTQVTVAWEGGEPDVDSRRAWGVEVGWKRTFDGTAWTAPELLKGKPFANLGLPKVAYDRKGRLHLTGTKGPRYYTTLPQGDRPYGWLTPEWLYHSRGAAFAEDTQGNLWAAFDGQNSGTTNEIYCRMLPASATETAMAQWTPALRVSEDDKRPSVYPDIAAEETGRVAVVWMDYRHKSAEVYAKVFADGRWSPDLLLSHGADEAAWKAAAAMSPNAIQHAPPEGLQSEYPHIARAGDGTLWAVWSDSEGKSGGRVMARCLTRKPAKLSGDGPHPLTPSPNTGRRGTLALTSSPLPELGEGPGVRALPKADVRLRPEFLADLTAYKRDFKPPEWAKPGRARQIRFDGGPMFAACQFESGWDYLTKPETPGYTGIIKAMWTLPRLYSSDIAKRLDDIRAAGYNWIWASYQLGYAFEDEARQRAQVRNLIKLAHARGMRVTAYFSMTSVFTRSAFVGDPESKNWIQENAEGQPVAYANIPIRLMACVNKPGRLDYLKKIVRLAVQDGADDIFWDSIFNRCYCQHCDKEFREYTRRVLGKPYGIPRVARDQGVKNFEESIDGAGVPGDVLENLFSEYNFYAPTKAIAELDKFAKSLNPNVLVSANTHRVRFMDSVVDVTWNEDGNRKGGRIDEQGKLTTPIGIYAWCQAIAEGRKPAQLTIAPFEYWQVQRPEYYVLTTAEAASFQANFVMLAGYAFATRREDGDPVAARAWEGIGTGLRFIERNQSLFENARPVGDVALYYSHAPRLAKSPSWEVVAQSLYRAGVPMQVLTGDAAVQRGAQNLRQAFALIALPGVSSLANEEIELLQEYARLGGKLLLTRESGQYTSFGQKRTDAPWQSETAGVHFVSAEEMESPERLGKVLESALQRPPMVQIGGNGYQIVNPTLQTNRMVFHILNYDTSRPQKDVTLTFSPRDYGRELQDIASKATTAYWLTPDNPRQTPVKLERRGDTLVMTIPELKVSGLLVLGK